MARREFAVGSRGSLLARRQTELTLDALRSAHPGARFQLRTVTTSGDRSQESLAEIGGRGVFVIELERALLDGEIDIAVHSLKDMPTASAEGLAIAAVTERADVRDVLISREGLTLAALPAGAVVGTGSPRRAAQLLAARPDLRVADIRGNVDTRIRKVEDGDYDATVLAAAGLARLGWLDRATEILPPELMLPAVGQGALALQLRADDAEAATLVTAVGHAPTERATAAERAFEARLGGGCHSAIAALGEIVPPLTLSLPALSQVEGSKGEPAPTLRLRGLVADVAGGRLLRDELEGPVAEAEALGTRLAETLIEQGASAILEAAS